MRLLLLSLIFCFVGVFALQAQKVLQIEKAGRAKTTKIQIGETITYRLKGEDYWITGVLEDLLMDQNILLLGNRYVQLDDIEALRFTRHWTKAASISLWTFGGAWSGFALVGTLTDGNPDTNYRWSDAVVSGVSWLGALIFSKLFRHKKMKLGKKHRLRMLDLTFDRPLPKP